MKRQRTPLGELCTLVKGTSPISRTPPGSYPLVTTGEEHKSADTFQFDAEAVCIPLISSTGHGHASLKRVHHQTGKFALANLLVAAVVKDSSVLSAKFLARYLMFTKDRFIAPLMTGAANMSISIDRLGTVPIEFPTLAGQDRIVKLLDEADELRKLRVQADHRTAEFLPALFHEMFGDPVNNPKGWPVRPVSSFVKELHGGRNVNPASADETNSRFRVLKISAVTWGDFQPQESKPVPNDYEPPRSHFVRAGDLLFSRANTSELVAATSYIFETPPNLLLPDKLWRFVWREPRAVEPLFVWWLFQATSVRRELSRRATGTSGSMKNISKPKVMTLEVFVPPLPIQKEFAKRVIEIRKLKAEQATSRYRLEDLFQSLLHRAFRGEL
jgi:type I restriction enzyme S subunit